MLTSRTRALIVAVLLAIPMLAGDPPWPVAEPSAHGLDAASLDAARAELARRQTKSFLIARDGQIVYEWYAPGHGPNKRYYTASLAKALTGGVSLLVALNDGLIHVDDPAWKYIPTWRSHPQKSLITIRHLATHSSGIEDAEQDQIPHMELPGWKGAFWRQDPDPFHPAIDAAPVLFPPGTGYAYSNPGMGALAYAITAALRGAPQTDIRSLLRQRIMKRIGASDEEWSMGYGKTFEVDGLNLQPVWGGGSYTARAVARVGQLMLQRGAWGNTPLVDQCWVDRVTSYAGTPIPERPPGNPQPASGLGWYSNMDHVWPRVPADAFAGAGARQQALLVVPSLGLLIVRNGGKLTTDSEPEGFWGGLERHVFNPVMDAVENYSPGRGLAETSPYPPSPVILRITFAEKSTVIRKAQGSDNWPLTWADDGALYSAYGDGWGFEPRMPKKLSLGFVRITGAPYDFQGINIPSVSGEATGNDVRGRKASGMLSISGRLYLLARNAGNSQLAWSDDHGRTWTWSDWKFTTSFGHPVFLNYGQDYTGARDNYVYIYSQDSDSAYETVDHMVLARVPKDRLRDRAAYQFYAGLERGAPRWSGDVAQRAPVFTNPGLCYRSSVSYNPALRRYLWVQVHSPGSPRFHGGLSIFDAPTPWGPWTTAFHTKYFDVGPGENAHLPTKWMSEDGSTMHLVSSSGDSFAVRRLYVSH